MVGRTRNRSRVSLVLGLALVVGKPLPAQELSVGVRGGLNASYTLFEVEAQGREVRPGLLLGAVFAYPVRPWLALQAEALFSQKGWGGNAREGNMRVSYLEVPVLIRLQHSGKLQPHLLLGPTVGMEVGCSFDETPQTERIDCDHNLISVDRSSLDFGLMTGAGIGHRVGRGLLSLDALLDFGLRDMIHEPLPWGTQTNLALSLSISYTVKLGGERGEFQ